MTTFQGLAKELVDRRVDQGEFGGYSDQELDNKVHELAQEFEQTWVDAHAQMLHDEPTDEDRRTWAAENRRDQERAA